MGRAKWAMIPVLLLASGGLYYLLRSVPPQAATAAQFAALYLAVFAVVFSLVAMAAGVRQGALFGLLAIAALWFSANSQLTLMTGILTLSVFALLEVYALNK